jgi:hypothetical protein
MRSILSSFMYIYMQRGLNLKVCVYMLCDIYSQILNYILQGRGSNFQCCGPSCCDAVSTSKQRRCEKTDSLVSELTPLLATSGAIGNNDFHTIRQTMHYVCGFTKTRTRIRDTRTRTHNKGLSWEFIILIYIYIYSEVGKALSSKPEVSGFEARTSGSVSRNSDH